MASVGRRFALLGTGLLAWEMVARSGLVSPILVPSLGRIARELGLLTSQAASLEEAWHSVYRALAGFALAAVVGVALGVLMGRVKAAENLLGMWVNVFASAPLSALVPVLMILFGMGAKTIVVSVFLFAIWIIALDTQAGVKHITPSLIDMARSFGAGRRDIYAKIILWAALPEILAGIRLGFIRGVKGVVIGQLLVSIIGYGELFEVYSRSFLMEDFWALTIVLFAFALLVAELVGMLEKRIEYYAGVRQ